MRFLGLVLFDPWFGLGIILGLFMPRVFISVILVVILLTESVL